MNMNMDRPDVVQHRQVGAHQLVKVVTMLLLPLLLAAIVACDNSSGSVKTSRAPYEGVPDGKPTNLGAPVPNPEEVLETKAAGQLPDFLSQLGGAARSKVAVLYKGAMDNYDIYSHIPCYCGCAIYAKPHRSLADCFIKERKDDGEVVFTDHSLTCELCQGAAQITVDGIAKGTPQKEIRAAVFNKLKYTGIWTDTPPAP